MCWSLTQLNFIFNKNNIRSQQISTKIKLELPYSKKWKSGYLNVNNDNRLTLTLYNSHNDRSSTQYARYLMAVHLGRFLESSEHIDHIDNDKTNNALSNLQILTLQENNIKTHKKENWKLTCPVCKKIFERTRTQVSGRLKKERAKSNTICCSRQCGGKYGHIIKK